MTPTRKLLAATAALIGLAGNGPIDADSRAWWDLTTELSGDAMEGRDTGSGGYERAARLVAQRLAAAGLKPLGDNGTWYQRIPFEELAVTDATLAGPGGELAFLHDFTVDPDMALPASLDAPLAYRGYCGADALGDVRGKLVICHGTPPRGPAHRCRSGPQPRRAAGAAGMMPIADPGFTRRTAALAFRLCAHRQRWPGRDFRQRPVRADRAQRRCAGQAGRGSERDAAVLVADGSRGAAAAVVRRLARPSTRDVRCAPRAIRLAQRRRACCRAPIRRWRTRRSCSSRISTATVTARAVDGDPLYNGTLDDAAYVALIVRLMETPREAQGFAPADRGRHL